ncbi:MAG: beta-lactamase family protein [Fimbriimonadaceae bacterium]|nr:beta-lactamase family protein [Fimbriimonadaceae bacterium]
MRRLPTILSLALVALTQAARADLTPAQVERIEGLVSAAMSGQGIPGASIAVVQEGRFVWTQGFGLADVENRVPATGNTVYRLASISKTITGVAAMILKEQGKLDLDAPVRTYVPGLPDHYATLTTRQVLGHIGGVRHYKLGETSSNRPYRDVLETLAQFAADPLVAPPGEKYEYSTFGFNVAGAVIQGAAGVPYEEFVKRAIFEQVGMRRIRPDDPFAIIPNRAQGYTLDAAGELRNSEQVNVTNKVPGGGFCSTAADLARFAAALLRGDLLKPESLEEMWTSQKTNDGNETGYGIGWGVQRGPEVFRVSHGGGQSRVATFLALWPGRKTAVAIMTNREGADLGGLANRIAKVVEDPAP